MRLGSTLLLAGTLGWTAPAAHAARPKPPEPGSVAGTVTLQEKDGLRGAAAAVVFIETADPSLWQDDRRIEQRRKANTVTMMAKKFSPRVLPVLAGEEVNFPNMDPVFHNVFSLAGKNKFDLGLYKDGKSKTRAFETPGVVRTYCNIHPGMTGFVIVLQNPWFALTGAEGTYRIPEVKPGKYTLKVWHERGGEATREVEIGPGDTATADFALDATGYRELPHRNKLNQEYGKGGDAY